MSEGKDVYHQFGIAQSEAEQRALGGQLFSASQDPWLRDVYYRARSLCHRYNQLPLTPENEREHVEIAQELFTHIGRGSRLIAPIFVDYGIHISIGEDTFINADVIFLDSATITIGSRVLVAPRVGFYTPQHPIEPEERAKGGEYAYPIVVEDDVWIGAGASILSGVTIGRGSIVAAGSVVVRSVPPRTIVAGCPAQIIRRIGEE